MYLDSSYSLRSVIIVVSTVGICTSLVLFPRQSFRTRGSTLLELKFDKLLGLGAYAIPAVSPSQFAISLRDPDQHIREKKYPSRDSPLFYPVVAAPPLTNPVPSYPVSFANGDGSGFFHVVSSVRKRGGGDNIKEGDDNSNKSHRCLAEDLQAIGADVHGSHRRHERVKRPQQGVFRNKVATPAVSGSNVGAGTAGRGVDEVQLV